MNCSSGQSYRILPTLKLLIWMNQSFESERQILRFQWHTGFWWRCWKLAPFWSACGAHYGGKSYSSHQRSKVIHQGCPIDGATPKWIQISTEQGVTTIKTWNLCYFISFEGGSEFQCWVYKVPAHRKADQTSKISLVVKLTLFCQQGLHSLPVPYHSLPSCSHLVYCLALFVPDSNWPITVAVLLSKHC